MSFEMQIHLVDFLIFEHVGIFFLTFAHYLSNYQLSAVCLRRSLIDTEFSLALGVPG